MVRKQCCVKEQVKRGAWSVDEDLLLLNYIQIHGEGRWRELPQRAGLNRCGKSCRLRWMNYVKPGIKRGNFSMEEDDLIIKMHKLIGNRWSLIAGRLPGRTDNEIKNYWNSHLIKKLQAEQQKRLVESKEKKPMKNSYIVQPEAKRRCIQVFLPQQEGKEGNEKIQIIGGTTRDFNKPSSSSSQNVDGPSDLLMDFNVDDLLISDISSSNFLHVHGDRNQQIKDVSDGDDVRNNLSSHSIFDHSSQKVDDPSDLIMDFTVDDLPISDISSSNLLHVHRGDKIQHITDATYGDGVRNNFSSGSSTFGYSLSSHDILHEGLTNETMVQDLYHPLQSDEVLNSIGWPLF
ncbi:PREDICTED: transcription repressor MYB5-like [Nelumbo nucifera]|uniref:Transcription repressor MYB5-like n=2 Tax=Nelumbo nucifera TaxID=4432 RepID=A0A1U8Q7A1_NELNU|nr:PREDICTED: transcription repressor MYB5-like [Nelumbo nucifera]DAD35680.1 TPA_asm: hypothetical protein HUJ06_006320 [Nelumbo nucifera]